MKNSKYEYEIDIMDLPKEEQLEEMRRRTSCADLDWLEKLKKEAEENNEQDN